jgi:hypothetical protein
MRRMQLYTSETTADGQRLEQSRTLRVQQEHPPRKFAFLLQKVHQIETKFGAANERVSRLHPQGSAYHM